MEGRGKRDSGCHVMPDDRKGVGGVGAEKQQSCGFQLRVYHWRRQIRVGPGHCLHLGPAISLLQTKHPHLSTQSHSPSFTHTHSFSLLYFFFPRHILECNSKYKVCKSRAPARTQNGFASAKGVTMEGGNLRLGADPILSQQSVEGYVRTASLTRQ